MLTRLRLQQESTPDLILVFQTGLDVEPSKNLHGNLLFPFHVITAQRYMYICFHHHFVQELPVVSESTAS